MRVLVTGASGFVGRSLCAALATRGHKLRLSLRKPLAPEQVPAEAETVCVGEIGPHTDWGMALQGVDAVVHLAARVHVMRDSPQAADEYHRINTAGTLALAQQARVAGVRRLLFVSSIKVNGESTNGRGFCHDDRPAPCDAYAESKLAAERGLQAMQGLETVIVRPSLVYGPGVKGNLARLCRLVHSGMPLPFGAIHNRRDLVCVDNLVDLLICCLEHPAAAGQIFLAADGAAQSTPQLCASIAEAMAKRSRIVAVPVWLLRFVAGVLGRSAEIDRLTQSLEIDSSHTRTTLGWKPPCTAREGTMRMVRAYLEQDT